MGLVTGPRARTPRTHSQWVVGPGRTPERTGGPGWESARPRTPHTKARGAPPGRPHAAPTARRSARCGVGDASPRPQPLHPRPGGSGPRPHARTDEWSGVEERPTLDAPHPGKRRPPPGTLMPAPQRAKPARKSARCGILDGSPCPHPPQPQPVGSGPWRHARTDERLEMGERPSPDAPHPGKRRPPRAPSCRPHSAQSQLARARAVRLVTGPHAHTPRTHSQWVVGSGRTPERTSGRGWESARPRTPHTEAEGAPPGTLMPPAQRAKPARKSARCGVGDGSPRPHPPHTEPVGSGPRPHARKDEWSGVGERPTPDTPHPGKRRPPRAPSCRPHSAQRQLARARAVGLVTGPHARTPRTHREWVVSPGPTPERTRGRGWESARPPTPHTQARGAPPGHPRAAPTARRQLARARAVGLVTGPHARTPRTHSAVGSGPRPHARKDERSGVGERPTPDAPHPGRRRPPRYPHAAPTARNASSQERALWGW